MITFVTFHIELSPEIKDKIKYLAPTVNYIEHEKYIQLMFRSAQRLHPGCRKVVIADLTSPLSLTDDIEIIRYDLPKDQLKIALLKARIRFLLELTNPSHVVFLDSDILIQENLNSLFKQNFDVAYTFRYTFAALKAPFNLGIIFVHQRGIKQAASLFEHTLDTLLKMAHTVPELLIWGGEQHAIVELIGRKKLYKRTSNLLDIDGVKVLILSRAVYNFSPEPQIQDIPFYPHKKILHFKGVRKEQMLQYWDKYLSKTKHDNTNF